MIQGSNFPTASTPDTESAEDFLAAPTSFGPSFPSEFPFENEPRKGKKKGKKGKKARTQACDGTPDCTGELPLRLSGRRERYPAQDDRALRGRQAWLVQR